MSEESELEKLRQEVAHLREVASALGRSVAILTPPEIFLLSAYGAFMLAWAAFEATLELGIMKKTGMDAARSSLVTSGLPFERRASILRSLLAGERTENEADNKEAMRLINSITQEASRNHLIHGLVFLDLKSDPAKIAFVHRITDKRFCAIWKEFTSQSLRELCRSIADNTARLRDILGIDPKDYEIFSNIGLILSNSSLMSPHAPDSKEAE